MTDLPPVQFGGVREFRALARRLERVNLARPLQSSIERAVEPLKRDAQREAVDRLPRRGGLNRTVAQTRITTQKRTRLTGGAVRLIAQSNAVKDPASIDRGRLFKPTFGHRPWKPQQVRAGWFRDPMRAGAPGVRRQIEAAVTREIRRGQGP